MAPSVPPAGVIPTTAPVATTKTHIVFRITYASTYVFLCLILAVLLLISPADIVRQAIFTTHQLLNIVVLAIVYALSVLVVLFVYSLRLYTSRAVLASIPKPWLSPDKADLPKSVRHTIVNSLSRAAAIAWAARPKVSPAGPPEPLQPLENPAPAAQPGNSSPGDSESAIPPVRPVWGAIDHPGWGPPDSPDLAEVQYSAVLAELPHLVEAKAVSLAPPDPDIATEPPTLDAEAVALLQRPITMTVRDYIDHLADIGVFSPDSESCLTEFVNVYEQARFSNRPMTNAFFRRLMRLFADLLRGMHPLNPAMLYDTFDGLGYPQDSESDGRHIDDDAPFSTEPSTPARSISGSLLTTGSIRSRSRLPMPEHHEEPNARGARTPSANTWHNYRTAPTTPKSRAGGERTISRSSSMDSFAQTRRPYAGSIRSSPRTNPSPRSASHASSQGSVIRLAAANDPDELPYVLRPSPSF